MGVSSSQADDEIDSKFIFIEIDKWGGDRKILDATLNETPFEQLDLVFKKFKEINGKELEEVVKDELDGRIRNMYQDLSEYRLIA